MQCAINAIMIAMESSFDGTIYEKGTVDVSLDVGKQRYQHYHTQQVDFVW